MPPPRDPLRELFLAALFAAHQMGFAERPTRVVLYCREKRKIVDLEIPLTISPNDQAHVEEDVPAGWSIIGNAVMFGGQRIPIAGRKLDVLRVLIEKEVATLEDLRAAWGGTVIEDGTIRWQIVELRKTLAAAFPDYPGDTIPATGNGYSLQIR